MSDLRISWSINIMGNPLGPSTPLPPESAHLTPLLLHVRTGLRGVEAYRLDGPENPEAIARFSFVLREPIERHVIGGQTFYMTRNEWNRFENQVGTRMHLRRGGLEDVIAGGSTRHRVTVCSTLWCHPLFRR